MREIVLDTETTGFDPLSGHRVVEIGCIELINHMPTDQMYQCYLNPDRTMPTEAFDVHGLSDEFLAEQRRFADVVDEFLAFIGDSPLIIHNASFDMGFLNAELARVDRPSLPMHRAIDTVTMARSKFPGQKNSLDALCKRFGIDNSHRELHGALKDSELLALVYLELLGGRQQGLGLAADAEPDAPDLGIIISESSSAGENGTIREARTYAPTEAEQARHAAFLDKLTDPVWHQTTGSTDSAD